MTLPADGNRGRLSGLVCLIIDTSDTMGPAIAERFLREGARVVLAGGVDDGGEGNLLRCRLDMSEETQWERLIGSVLERFRRLDVLVNASDIVDGTDVETVSREHVVTMSEVMIEGTAIACKHALPVIHRSGGRGAIVNVAPADGNFGSPTNVGRALVGGAIEALTRSTAIHCFDRGYDIRCNAVLLGIDGAQAVADPTEIADAAVYLASSESGYVNGHSIVLDGGVGSFRR